MAYVEGGSSKLSLINGDIAASFYLFGLFLNAFLCTLDQAFVDFNLVFVVTCSLILTTSKSAYILATRAYSVEVRANGEAPAGW